MRVGSTIRIKFRENETIFSFAQIFFDYRECQGKLNFHIFLLLTPQSKPSVRNRGGNEEPSIFLLPIFLLHKL